MIKSLEEAIVQGRLGKGIARLVGKPGSLRLRLARDTFGVMVLQGGSMGLGFVISVLLARVLGVKEFGLYAFGWSFLSLLSTPAAFGFPQLLVREIAASRAKGEWGAVHGIVRFSWRIVLWVSLGLGFLAGLGLWLFSGSLSAESVMTLVVALLGLPLLALVQLQGSALRGLDRILAGQAVQMLVRPVSFLLLFGGTWFVARELLSAPFALGLQVVAAGVALLAGGLLLRRHMQQQVPEASSLKNAPAWLRSALWLLLLALLNLIPQHAGVLLLGMMRGAEEVGLYKVAYQVASLIPFGLMAVNTVIAPTISHFYALGDVKKLKRVLIAAVGVALVTTTPLILTFTIGSNWFVSSIFGKDYFGSVLPLRIISVGFLINALGGPYWLFLLMSGSEKYLTNIALLASTTNVLVNILAIPYWGFNGASLAMAMSLTISGVLPFYIAYRQLKEMEQLCE